MKFELVLVLLSCILTFMNHEMKLQPGPFSRIKDGSKVIESRLFDEKRQQIKIGDTITFIAEPERVESLKTQVTGLLRYGSFDEMMSDIPTTLFGGNAKEELISELEEFYTKEMQKEHGVLGIRIKLV